MPKPANPSAFPVPSGTTPNGMTLRDYFAAKAMEGILRSVSAEEQSAAEAARSAYMVADAMLKAREAPRS